MPDNNLSKFLDKTVAALSLHSNSGPACEILAETGFDEAILLGTPEAFIALATVLLRCASVKVSENANGREDFEVDEDLGAPQAVTTNIIKQVFEDSGDVWPMCAVVVSDTNEHSLVRAKICCQ